MGNEQNNKEDNKEENIKEDKNEKTIEDKKQENKKYINEKNGFFMNINFIGKDLINFHKQILSSKKLISIKDYWKFGTIEETLPIKEQINKYFKFLEEKKHKNQGEKEAVIIKVKNIDDQELNYFLEKMNEIEQKYYMPLVLILYEEKKEKQTIQNIETFSNIDSRFIKIEKYSEDFSSEEEPISDILLRFCSIHNDLGDLISIPGKENIDLTKKYYAFNLNIACIGRTGQGKSAGVNALLKEYRAKESDKGCSQTRSLTFYQVENQPIRILDIPGYEDEDSIRQSIEKFKSCREEINRLRDNIHVILYFFNSSDENIFYKMEYPMLDEINEMLNYKSQIIYVFTHSKLFFTEDYKKKLIKKINSGIKRLSNYKKEKELNIDNKNIYENLFASNYNTVFVNFHKDEQIGDEFGIKELFTKIRDFYVKLIKSGDLSSLSIEDRASILKAQAKKALLANKIWGSVVGILPGIDWVLQKFVIKKNAVKKVGNIFGIDVQFINEKVSDDSIENGIKNASGASAYISGGIALSEGIARASTAVAQTASIGLKVAGIGMAAVGCVFGVGLGGYLTYTYCEELLDKFEEFYKKNAKILEDSYEKTIEYLSE